jgi:hypothetical protein
MFSFDRCFVNGVCYKGVYSTGVNGTELSSTIISELLINFMESFRTKNCLSDGSAASLVFVDSVDELRLSRIFYIKTSYLI